MEWVKTTAKTLPEAIDLALDNLGVDEAEAEIVVLEEPRQGLFGRMRGTARVEARVKPKPIRPKNERGRNRRGRSGSGSGGGSGGDGGKGGAARGGRNRNRSRNRNKSRDGNRQNEDRNDRRDRSGGESADQGDRTRSGQSNQGRRSQKGSSKESGRGGRSSEQNESDQPKARGRQRDNRAESVREEKPPVEESPMEEVAENLERFLSGLTEAFGFDDGVSIDNSEPDVLVGQVNGQHGLMVGPKGRTLDAVQELARISCQRSSPSSIRIKVDVGGYRKQRSEALAAFAAKAAEKAMADGAEVALEPMSAADRKAVHDALSDDDRVETRSIGTDPRRRVLVVPVASTDDTDADIDSTDIDSDVHDSAGSDDDVEQSSMASNGAVDEAEADSHEAVEETEQSA